MAIRVKSRGGESAEQMMRRFKKLCEKEGLNKDIKRKEYYEKPSERRRRDVRKSIARRLREIAEANGEIVRRPGGKFGPRAGGPGAKPGMGPRGPRPTAR